MLMLVEPRWATRLTVYHFIFSCSLVLIWAYALRLFGWVPKYELQNQVMPKRTYTLKSLVIWTTVIGMLVALAIRIKWSEIFSDLSGAPVLEIALDSSSRIFVAVVAYWSIRRMGPFAPSVSCSWTENSQNSDAWYKWSQATSFKRLSLLVLLALVLLIVILPKAYLRSNGYPTLYLVEELWYASFQYLPIVVVVFAGFVEFSDRRRSHVVELKTGERGSAERDFMAPLNANVLVNVNASDLPILEKR